MYLEGKNAISEALRSDMPLREVLIADGVKPDAATEEIERRARKAGVSVRRVARRELDALSERGAHQGVMAQAKPFAYTPIEQVIASVKGAPDALVIVLDHVTDPGNLGAVVRTAEVVGAAGVVVAKKRSAAVTAAAWKTSAGALAHIALVQEPNVVRVLERLKKEGFWIAGASEHASDVVWLAPMDGRIALVMGSEGDGLARLTRESCDFLVALPQTGAVGSLNVAQATTAIAYEWMRRVWERSHAQ